VKKNPLTISKDNNLLQEGELGFIKRSKLTLKARNIDSKTKNRRAQPLVKSNFEDIIVSNLEGVLIMDESQNNFSELRKEIEEKGLELLDDEFFPPNKTKIYISPESRLLKYDILLENIEYLVEVFLKSLFTIAIKLLLLIGFIFPNKYLYWYLSKTIENFTSRFIR
jgi:hypothetical protein